MRLEEPPLALREESSPIQARARGQGQTRGLVQAHSDRITPVTLDITDGDQVAAVAASLPAKLDGLVNNAGAVVIAGSW